jgi:hypothetical protein
MAFINERMGALSGMAALPDILLRRIPHLGAEHLGGLVLHYAGHIGRDALSPAAGPFDEEFVQLAVTEEHLGQFQLPTAVSQGFQGIAFRALPVVEIADQLVSNILVTSLSSEYDRSIIPDLPGTSSFLWAL